MFTKFFTVSTLSLALLTAGSVALSQDTPLCFMKKSDGTVINLNKLCKDKKPVSQQPSRQAPDPNQGSDGGQPSSPDNVLDPSVKLVPGQTQKPPIEVYKTPSDLWQQVPGLQTPIQEIPVR
ncbi:hypothetical protein H6F86_25435 [Phormidium sp. FACHB-592]|uniref:Uncharacterized protein n=1 Tax=Stenomitos frigidus AS-A4 TaxID=2933935 RepID=A0ABV0KT91_9CYAN|nr:hypothetical protein [Phormidium sp. FACHB-592]MBD2077164.1 hypothetical protein [Phormidium sp. FACHB-592]